MAPRKSTDLYEMTPCLTPSRNFLARIKATRRRFRARDDRPAGWFVDVAFDSIPGFGPSDAAGQMGLHARRQDRRGRRVRWADEASSRDPTSGCIDALGGDRCACSDHWSAVGSAAASGVRVATAHAPTVATAAKASWKLQAVLQPAGYRTGYQSLSGVSCGGASCFAVGSYAGTTDWIPMVQQYFLRSDLHLGGRLHLGWGVE
jgi:hypothetical protein